MSDLGENHENRESVLGASNDVKLSLNFFMGGKKQELLLEVTCIEFSVRCIKKCLFLAVNYFVLFHVRCPDLAYKFSAKSNAHCIKLIKNRA